VSERSDAKVLAGLREVYEVSGNEWDSDAALAGVDLIRSLKARLVECERLRAVAEADADQLSQAHRERCDCYEKASIGWVPCPAHRDHFAVVAGRVTL